MGREQTKRVPAVFNGGSLDELVAPGPLQGQSNAQTERA